MYTKIGHVALINNMCDDKIICIVTLFILYFNKKLCHISIYLNDYYIIIAFLQRSIRHKNNTMPKIRIEDIFPQPK